MNNLYKYNNKKTGRHNRKHRLKRVLLFMELVAAGAVICGGITYYRQKM